MSRALALVLMLAAAPVFAAGGAAVPFHFKADTGDLASLQKGARNYMAYCAGCHSLKYLRYNRIGKDLNIPDDLLKKHLMPAGAKPGDVIKTAMPAAGPPGEPSPSEKWFGRAPPDLSLTARERGPDWVYSYLLSFYLDPTKPTGVNNLVLDGVSMPHVLGGLQGWQKQILKEVEEEIEEKDKEGNVTKKKIKKLVHDRLELTSPGSLSAADYKEFVSDLTNFMVYAAEPGRNSRLKWGWAVLAWVLLFWGLAYLLKLEYWKDVH